jgi:hydroxymethylbilane synthase
VCAVERLSLKDGPGTGALDPSRWVPPPGQGALAVEALAERLDLQDLFAGLTDAVAAAEIACERSFAARLGGGCSVPIGCLARAGDGHLVVSGFLALPDASESVRDRVSGGAHEPVALGAQLAEAMLAAGGEDIIADLRELDGIEPSAP